MNLNENSYLQEDSYNKTFITFKYKALKKYKNTLLKDLAKDIIIVAELEI